MWLQKLINKTTTKEELFKSSYALGRVQNDANFQVNLGCKLIVWLIKMTVFFLKKGPDKIFNHFTSKIQCQKHFHGF